MRLVLELAILSGVVVCAATVTAVLTVRWWLARQNRVDRRRPSWAPSRWVWWPTRAARLHRRLRNAVSMVESCLPRSRRRRLAAAGSLAELVEGVSQQAVLVDDRLVVAARAPAPLRFVRLLEVESQVREVETLAARVARHAGRGRVPNGSPGASVAERLDALDQAYDELKPLALP